MQRILSNKDIADRLREMAAYYEMEDVPFKPAAYERAADAITATSLQAADLLHQDGWKGLKKIDGVGESIARHIEGLLTKGTFPEYDKFRERYPFDVLAITSIEDVGPKRAKQLFEALRVKDLAGLEKAARIGRIRDLPGFGEKLEKKIIKGIEFKKKARGRMILGHVLPVARDLEETLRSIPGVRHAVAAGSVRRMQETVGDLDILVTTSSPERVMQVFAGFPEVVEVLEHGPTKTVVRLRNGLQADVRVVEDDAFGAALQYFTGSKEHNVVVRKMAIAKGLKLNEYGIWRGKKRLASRTEEDVYKVLGLPYIEPEIRTAGGEIEAAKRGKLPRLINYRSIKGDLQVQTDWTDGAETIEVMAEEARSLGLEYIAVTDHTKSLAMTGGLDEGKLVQQAKMIDLLNDDYRRRQVGFKVLKGTEVNILKDGALDLHDKTLARLDVVGAAIHSHFNLPRAEQTSRMIAAMRNPHVDVIFHPTGRIIHEREPYDIDMEAVLKEARRTGTAMEIDAYPDRSDLRDAHVRMSVALGVKLLIDTDAHHPSHFKYLDLGVAIARRGWATKKDVLNTRGLDDLLAWLDTPKDKR
jgi:DNA polymerase (family 10)